jgi:hypothetical protein
MVAKAGFDYKDSANKTEALKLYIAWNLLDPNTNSY